MRILFVFTILFLSLPLFSQIVIPTHDFSSLGDLDVAYSKIRNFNSLPAGQKKVNDLSYADVKGSPFWSNDWNPAVLILANGSIAKTQKAKLDLYSHEVHFLNSSNIELSFDNNQISKIYFFKGTDTTNVIAVFESFLNPLSNTKAYYKVLNEGRFKLLELIKVLVKENDYDPVVGKKEYSFYSKKNYAIADYEKISTLKSLSESSIFTVIFKSTDYYEWLQKNNNSLKSEADIISFFNYVNAKEKR